MKTVWEQAKKGDRKAWNLLYVRYQEANLALAEKTTRNREDAEDVVQEAWLAVWQNRATIEDLGGWLRRAIRSLALNTLRTRKRQRIFGSYPFTRVNEDGQKEWFEGKAESEEDDASLSQAIIRAHPSWEDAVNAWLATPQSKRLLDPKDHEIGRRLWCSHPEQSRREIALELGIPETAIRAAAMRIRRAWTEADPKESDR